MSSKKEANFSLTYVKSEVNLLSLSYFCEKKMAEEALKKLEEQLNCPICLDIYTDPKLLQCFHVCCQQCLVPLTVQDQQGKLSLTCPTCRQVTAIPGNAVGSLPSAFHINHLLELRKSFKEAEKSAAALENAIPTALDSIKTANLCSIHNGKELELYCGTCEELICLKCALKGGKHHSHDCEELKEAFQKYKDEITPSLEPVERKIAIIKRKLAEFDVHRGEISDKQAATESEIHTTFRRMRALLESRETELIGRLHKLTQLKLKGLAEERDQVETILAQLSSCLHYMRESLKPGNEGDVLKMKVNTFKQVKELTTFQADDSKLYAEADISFSTPIDADSLCQNYGIVSTSFSPDLSKCHVTGRALETAIVREKSTVLLQTVNIKGESCEVSLHSLHCELASKISGNTISCTVEKRRHGQYEICYQPTAIGDHQLHIKIEGRHIRGSPFSIAVNILVEKLGTPILTISGLNTPVGVAINLKREIVVSETGNHCISVFSPTGVKLRSFGSKGSCQGQFKHPKYVTHDNEGSILVADDGNNRIQKFTADGDFLTAVGTWGSRPLQFSSPHGIAWNARNNKVYVADRANNRVQILNSDLTFSHAFGVRGNGMGQFKFPWDIACDSTGQVYVADSWNHCIQVFTIEGVYIRKIGVPGVGKGELNHPSGVAIDASDKVYITKRDNHRVSVFTSEGQFLTSFGTKGVGHGESRSPIGLAVDTNGIVYVCDTGNNKI